MPGYFVAGPEIIAVLRAGLPDSVRVLGVSGLSQPERRMAQAPAVYVFFQRDQPLQQIRGQLAVDQYWGVLVTTNELRDQEQDFPMPHGLGSLLPKINQLLLDYRLPSLGVHLDRVADDDRISYPQPNYAEFQTTWRVRLYLSQQYQ